MGNRIKELRRAKGLSQEKLAERLHSGRSTILKLEHGKMKLTTHWMERIAVELDVSPADLISGDGFSVPVTMIVGAAFGRNGGGFDLDKPYRRVQLPGLARPEQCFAAAVEDDSADRLYPQGSLVICRRTEHAATVFKIGCKVLARHFEGSHAGRLTMEILAGRLDRTYTGELVLVTASRNGQVPTSVVIQRPLRADAQLSERFTAPAPVTDSRIEYAPRADDQAEIVGLIVMAITPE
ncbi:MAG: helix-turn-helix transcriptional regulator [Sulfuritalea sp.]|nr:helix-turn-helix transcriptional regulator [Sulfuritalea sp.]